MKEKIKSIVLVIVMLVSVCVTGFTIYHAKTNVQTDGNMPAVEERTPDELEENSQAPEMPDHDMENELSVPDQALAPDMENKGQMQQMPDDNFRPDEKNQLTVVYIVIISAMCAVFSFCLLYLIMNCRNRKFYKNKDKLIIFILSVLLLTTYLAAGISFGTNYFVMKDNHFKEEETQKDSVTLDESNIAASQTIDLSEQETDVTITQGGTYELSGAFNHSVIIDAQDEEVELVLNNAEISNEKTAAIIGKAANKITINLKEGTKNVLSDGGNSEYDGCIFSNAELYFYGTGELAVNGNQNEGEGIATEAADITIEDGTYMIHSNDDGLNAGGDGATITINGGNLYIDASGDGIDSNKNAVINGGTIFVIGSDVGGDSGIDTDEGYTINGGFVVALGSDMIETPDNTSMQNSVAFTLDEKIDKDTMVSLMKDDEVLVSFNAPKSFRTLIISKDSLENGDYKLYTGEVTENNSEYGIYTDSTYTKDNALAVNNQDVFTASDKVNIFPNR